MDNTPEILLKPNYLGLLTTALIMVGAIVLFSNIIGFIVVRLPTLELEDQLMISPVILVLSPILVVCVASLLDTLRTALTGMRLGWQVRIDREGVHHPLLSSRPIRWDAVETIAVANGYNGKDILITLDPASVRLNGISLYNGLISLIERRRVSYLRLLSHKFEIDTLVFLRTLQEIVPERLRFAYSIDW